jgi:hypothetical protein
MAMPCIKSIYILLGSAFRLIRQSSCHTRGSLKSASRICTLIICLLTSSSYILRRTRLCRVNQQPRFPLTMPTVVTANFCRLTLVLPPPIGIEIRTLVMDIYGFNARHCHLYLKICVASKREWHDKRPKQFQLLRSLSSKLSEK